MAETWTIGTDRSDGGIVANGELSASTPTLTRGTSTSLDFGFWHDPTIDSQEGDHVTRYEKLRQYLDFAGSMSVQRAVNGQPHYTERIPSDAAIDSLVLDFKPGADVDSMPGLWGILKGGEDPTRYPADSCRLRLDVVVLAERSEYNSRSAVANALGESVV